MSVRYTEDAVSRREWALVVDSHDAILKDAFGAFLVTGTVVPASRSWLLESE